MIEHVHAKMVCFALDAAVMIARDAARVVVCVCARRYGYVYSGLCSFQGHTNTGHRASKAYHCTGLNTLRPLRAEGGRLRLHLCVPLPVSCAAAKMGIWHKWDTTCMHCECGPLARHEADRICLPACCSAGIKSLRR